MGRHREQRGQVFPLVAFMMTAIFGFASVGFDAGLAMADRRAMQANADDAVLAGARAYSLGTNQAHYVALLYLAKEIGFTLPLGNCQSLTNCPAGTYTWSTYTFTLSDAGNNNLDLTVQHSEVGLFSSVIGSPAPTAGGAARATPTGPTMTSATYTVAAVGPSAQVLLKGGGTGTHSFGGPVYASDSFGGNNNPHSIPLPAAQTDYSGATCSGSPANSVNIDSGSNSLYYHWTGGTGTLNTAVASPTQLSSVGPTTTSPTYTSSASAKDGSGHWKPGIYSGIYPSGGNMNAGVYKIINVGSTISLGVITNTTYTSSGTSDTNGAVAIVLDSTDTGALDISAAVLNGLDDLNSSSYSGTRDPQGTHNFVIYGGSGASGYIGSVTLGPGSTTDISGIVYLPQSTFTSNGNTSFTFTGSATFSSVTLHGSGGAVQTFAWVCGLNAVSAGGTGGLVR